MSTLNWWENLEPDWQRAFRTVVFGHQDRPSVSELEALLRQQVLRFAGPGAPYPNMDFQLGNLSGIKDLDSLETLVVTHHRISELGSLKSLTTLKSLFLFNNEIESLAGIENLVNLEHLYVQANRINNINALSNLTSLKELYINDNLISSLAGVTRNHKARLSLFVCLPNAHLRQEEILYVENQLGIKCRGL